MRKKMLSLALALVMCLGLTVPALAADSDFVIENGVLTKYNGSSGDVVVPSGVTSIGYRAFAYKYTLTSVTIPDSVTCIVEGAFRDCDNLTSVNIPSGVTTIESQTFYHCSKLAGITIPEGVTSIGGSAFSLCNSLTSVTIPASVTSITKNPFDFCQSLTAIHVSSGNQTYTDRDGVLFSKDMTTLVIYPTGKQGPYVIPDSVVTIGAIAFAYCKGLTGVTIPTSVTTIKDGAFSSCDSLTSITIPASVTRVLDEMFGYSYLDIGLTDVYYGGSEAQWNAVTVGKGNDPLKNAAIHYNSAGPDKPTQSTVGNFTDVKTGDYFAEPVAWAVEKGITAGTSKTTFSPNATCTQAQILTFLWHAKGEPKPTGAVSGTQYYATAAQWAKEQGLTDNFSAEADCTRAMVVTYLWKLAGSPNAGTSDFTDVPANADYAQAVAWAVEQGITSGIGNGQFAANSTCTRGQIVTFLYRAFAK